VTLAIGQHDSANLVDLTVAFKDGEDFLPPASALLEPHLRRGPLAVATLLILSSFRLGSQILLAFHSIYKMKLPNFSHSRAGNAYIYIV